MSGAAVTPTGVREGDPAALAALCAVRGPSVVAYCRHVVGPAEAGAAAADAFARFRVAVVNAGDTSSVNPEALLISATRTSAAAHANTTGQGHCAQVPVLLAARAEKTISPEDLERLGTHLEECWACRAPVARFKAAERAYRDPPEKTVDPERTAQIVGALIAAVPPPAAEEAAPVSSNGDAAHAAEAHAAEAHPAEAHPAEAHAAEAHAAEAHAAEAHAAEAHAAAAHAAEAPAPSDPPPDQPTEQFAAPGALDPALADGDAETAVARRRRRVKAPAAAGALLARLRPASGRRGPREQRPARKQARAAAPPVAAAPRPRDERSRLRLALVLPIVVVLLALVAALYVAGVLGGSDPQSSPATAVPTAEPVDTKQPDLVAVPGAKEASGDAVEAAKARARGERDPAAARQDEAKSDDASDAPARTSSPPPASSSPPAAASPPPPPPPPPPRDRSPSTESSGDRATPKPQREAPAEEQQLNAGGGATAPEIPTDAASDVPGLAPAPTP